MRLHSLEAQTSSIHLRFHVYAQELAEGRTSAVDAPLNKTRETRAALRYHIARYKLVCGGGRKVLGNASVLQAASSHR